jgi:hypothetical protein
MASIRKYKTKEGEIKYYVQIRLKGYPAQTGKFDRITDAKRWIQETESDIRNNRYFKQQNQENILLKN